MKVSEAIEKLNVGDTVWVKGEVAYINKSGVLPLCIKFAERTKVFVEADEISLTEPKNEKVVVPSVIDKFIKYHADPIFEICAWSDHYGNDGRTCDDPELSVVLDWYGNNTTEFYEAVVNGYIVKPKRWVVKIGDYHSTYIESLTIIPKLRYTLSEQEGAYKFTDHAKAEAVATLVEGQVEEVAE